MDQTRRHPTILRVLNVLQELLTDSTMDWANSAFWMF